MSATTMPTLEATLEEPIILQPAPRLPRFLLVSPSNKVDDISIPVLDPEHIPELRFELQVCDLPLHSAGQAISEEFPGFKDVSSTFHFRPCLRTLQCRHGHKTRKTRSQHDCIIGAEIESPYRTTQAAQLEDLIDWRLDLRWLISLLVPREQSGNRDPEVHQRVFPCLSDIHPSLSVKLRSPRCVVGFHGSGIAAHGTGHRLWSYA
jgi:hypothetical protein